MTLLQKLCLCTLSLALAQSAPTTAVLPTAGCDAHGSEEVHDEVCMLQVSTSAAQRKLATQANEKFASFGKGGNGGSYSCEDYTKQYDSYDNMALKNGNPFGASDIDEDRCSFYGNEPHQCGKHDDGDFIANEMCCNCGGGSTYKGPRSIAVNHANVFISEGAECPNGFDPIDTLSACRAALDMVGMAGWEYNGADSEHNWPKGCYYCKNVKNCAGGVWFNSHDSGSTVEGTFRFCHKQYNPHQVEILFVGDSDIDYWESSTSFPGSMNVGIGGYTTSDVIKEVDQWVADLNPKWVVIVCGENDIDGKREETAAAFDRFKTIVNKFIADGARVIYLGTKPEPGSKNIYDEYKFYDEEIRKWARGLAVPHTGLPDFQMIDVFKSFTSATELYNSDELHMSRLGYKFWNGWVKIAMGSATPCIRWRDGVCVEVPSA
jgi:hypothetical protein